MRILLADSSVPLSPDAPATRPLGGPERAFVHLARALAEQAPVTGHEIWALTEGVEGVEGAEEADKNGLHWRHWGDDVPATVDILIASSAPALARLSEVTARMREVIDWRRAPAVSTAFDARQEDVPAPVALTTDHPAGGLPAVVAGWVDGILPRLPAALTTARLDIYSGTLLAAQEGRRSRTEGAVAALWPLIEAAGDTVRICRPLPEPGMAAAYRQARLQLYGQRDSSLPWMLLDSRACGLPALAFEGGAAAQMLKVDGGGYVVPDAEAFANLALSVLGDDGIYNSLRPNLIPPLRWPETAGQLLAYWQRSLPA